MTYSLILKKNWIALALALLPVMGFAQVKVGDNPDVIESSAELEIESTSKGFLPPRMTEAQMNAIVSPAEGLMVFCTDCMPKGPYTFDATAWMPLSGSSADIGSNGTSEVSSYSGAGCAGGPGSISGTMTVGVAVSGVTMTLYADVTQAGTWSLTAIQNGVTFSGNGTFAATGCQQITLTGSGTPVASGSFTWATNTAPFGSATAEVAPEPSAGGSAVVASYGAAGCSGGPGSISGTMTQGAAVSGLTMELYANVTQPGTWSLEATENGVTFSGSGTFAATGCQLITLTGSGTPAALGTYTWTTNTTPAGSAEATVNAPPAPPSNPTGSGSFSGPTCFDIALSNYNSNDCAPFSARIDQQKDFTEPTTYTQSYTFTPLGTVSNVRFFYTNTNGIVITGISGDNPGNNISGPVVATVNFSTTLNTDALGLTNANPLTADIYVIYNSNSSNTGTDRQIKATVKVKDCACCGAYANFQAGIWKQWMCHNLAAANTNADPLTPSWEIIGGYWQWGRKGPDPSVWKTTNTANFAHGPTGPMESEANAGRVNNFSAGLAGNTAWREDNKTQNDPCPAGYRIPTRADFNSLIKENVWSNVGSWGSSPTNYSSGKKIGRTLFLPAAGSRTAPIDWPGVIPGSLSSRGQNGFYWTSYGSSTGGGSTHLTFHQQDYGNFVPALGGNGNNRTRGMSIRCIAE
jgi:uncharacterized protein (TIGR02145 family)